MTAAPPLIAFAHVGKSFDGGRVRAVDDLSIEVAEGEFLAIVGGSGSGKTTLLRLANRLIDADEGHITVEGEDVRAVDPVQLRRRIGYVFQSGGLFSHISVAGNIGITPKLQGTPAAEIASRVDQLLDLVRLDRTLYRDRFPHELSGGQRQRVGVALALGLLASLPLAIAARNQPVMRGALLGLASIVQTIPGLALLALFYPLLLALAALSLAWFGFGFSAFGFLPAVLALALYSMLPVLRNTITGLQGLDAAILEAAQGVGMTSRQSLFMVELPLALPVIMAGLRTAAVWVIGTATLSTPIGQTSLGNYIFAGLQTQNWVFVLFGCFAAAVLALAVDQLLTLIEAGISQRSRVRAAFGGLGLAAIVALAVIPSLATRGQTYV